MASGRAGIRVLRTRVSLDYLFADIDVVLTQLSFFFNKPQNAIVRRDSFNPFASHVDEAAANVQGRTAPSEVLIKVDPVPAYWNEQVEIEEPDVQRACQTQWRRGIEVFPHKEQEARRRIHSIAVPTISTAHVEESCRNQCYSEAMVKQSSVHEAYSHDQCSLLLVQHQQPHFSDTVV